MTEINSKLYGAKADESKLEDFIKEHKKFILANAYKTTGRYITDEDDEWSVGLIAFHEAVKTFDESKGDFHSFAALVIKRRLVDYIRSEARHAGETPVAPEMISGEIEDDSPDTAIGMKIRESLSEDAAQEAMQKNESSDVRDEIEAVQKLLSEYGFSFFDIADQSPKAEKTKKLCARAVAVLLTEHEIFEKMQKTKSVPVKEICEKTLVHRKILERHRKYIIAAAVILNGDYPLLAEYMSYIRKEMMT